eukprot:3364389-Pleurochrysis_carterae.AAC.1
MEPQVMSRVASKSAPSATPISPPRSRRLWASSAAAHSTTPRREPLSYPCRASAAKCAARKARLSFRSPGG